jgi:hypothetical protein
MHRLFKTIYTGGQPQIQTLVTSVKIKWLMV